MARLEELAFGRRQILRIIGMLAALTAIGTLGFRLIEGADWLDCFYMTVITLSTVGYEHVVKPSAAGKLFIAAYLACGFGVFTFSVFTLGQWLVGDELRQYWERRRMDAKIAELDGHHVVCGLGRVGRLICEELEEKKCPFVVIDNRPDRLAVCRERGWLHVAGDATDDDTLREAGVGRAASVAAVLPADADNVYVSLSVRLLCDRVRIVARATEEKAVEKLKRAGADRVVSPLASGATKIARFLTDPNMEEFLDIAAGSGEELELADLKVPHDAPLVGRRLRDTDLRHRGLIVLCIRRADGTNLVPPPADAEIRAGDLMFLFGGTSAVRSAAERIGGPKADAV